MSREFAITAPATTLSLGPDSRGEVAFTVSNVTDHVMRAVVRLMPAAPMKAEWLSARGADHREMPPGATEVFTVDVHVPPGAPPGPYTFRIVVADLDLPDERFAEGPAISVEASPPPLPKKGIPWWWLVLGGLVIAGGAMALFLGLRDEAPETQTPTCPAGQALCGDQCTNLQADEGNCGACGNACGENLACQEGQCVDTRCPRGQTPCGSACVDTAKDDKNCGKCGNACGTGLFCRDGSCQCPSGLTLCGGKCVDARKDATNCGKCNVRCGANQVCEDGRCICTGGLTLCGGQCVKTDTDRNNCKTCGFRCAGNQICTAGKCQCSTGLNLCGSTCVNFQSDEANCGRCGGKCTTSQECRSGKCVLRTTTSCPLGQILCPCTGTCLVNATCMKLCAAGTKPF
ncbi:MXAN_6577-like cysteine-rich protein [Pyxidicoccus sp. 3LG]